MNKIDREYITKIQSSIDNRKMLEMEAYKKRISGKVNAMFDWCIILIVCVLLAILF